MSRPLNLIVYRVEIVLPESHMTTEMADAALAAVTDLALKLRIAHVVKEAMATRSPLDGCTVKVTTDL